MSQIDAADTSAVVAAFAAHDPRVAKDKAFRSLMKRAGSQGEGALAGYVRISQFRGLDESAGDIGIVRQAKDIAMLAVDANLRVGTWHLDNDVSASSGKPRPGYEAAFQRLASGHATGLVAWDLVRLYRRGAELERLVELVERADEVLTVRTVKTGANALDLSEPMGRMMARMMVWAAEMETYNQSSRQQASQRHRASAGLWHGGTLPFGYTQRPGAPGHLDVVEAEADLIRWGAAAILEGRTLGSIVQHFEDSGVRPHRAAHWSRAVVRGLYLNDSIAGLRTHTPRRIRSRTPARGAETVLVDAVWDAIIPIETLERIRAILHDPARGGGLGSRPPQKWWAGRSLVCGVCGGPMYGKKRAHRSGNPLPSVYLCRSGACVTAPTDLVEAWAEAVVLRAYRNTTAVASLTSKQQEELDRIESQRQEAMGMLDAGGSVATVTSILDRLASKETAIRAATRRAEGPRKGQTVDEWWADLTIPEKSGRLYDLGLDIVVAPILVRGTRRVDQADPGFTLRERA